MKGDECRKVNMWKDTKQKNLKITSRTVLGLCTLWHYWISCKNLHLPVTLALHWHCPVFWSQLGAPAEVLIVPTSLQLQRMQPFGFEALRPDQPGKQFSHWRPVTATLHWHWPPTWRWETRTKKDKAGVTKLEPPKRATPNLQWFDWDWEDLSTYEAAVDCSSDITVTWLTHVRRSGIKPLQPEKPTDAQLTIPPWQEKRTETGLIQA